ncbi:MAG TPA: histidine kinase, partial [Polymorphobacter sp.]|nr:histidine kinase [Polymorphobacter sp.]
AVTQAEFLALRRKAFAKLDTDKDGVLSFEEAAVKTIAKFTGADADHDGKLTAGEFEATSSKRRSGDEG